MFRTGLLFAATLILTALPAAVQAQGKKSSDVVKVTATADKPDVDGKQTVTITIALTDKAFHIYANPVGNEDLANAATEVEISAGMKPASVKITYPVGHLEVDKFVGNYRIYENQVEIKADVVRAKGDTGPLKAAIKLQACSKNGTCLVPATIDVAIP